MDKIMMDEKDTYQNTMETRLDRLARRIDDLQTRAEKLSGNARMEINKLIAEFMVRHASIRQKFQKMKHTSGDIWFELISGLENATTELKESIDNAGPKLKQKPNINPAAKWVGLAVGGAVAAYFIRRFIRKRTQ